MEDLLTVCQALRDQFPATSESPSKPPTTGLSFQFCEQAKHRAFAHTALCFKCLPHRPASVLYLPWRLYFTVTSLGPPPHPILVSEHTLPILLTALFFSTILNNSWHKFYLLVKLSCPHPHQALSVLPAAAFPCHRTLSGAVGAE